jgi:UDP-3-O-[3-hydroxymyristoyl] glucosamine N-acyltransferase
VLIDKGVTIGDNTVIEAGCKIGENARIGNNCRLDKNIVVYHNCTIGNNVLIQANTTIGSIGFGYYFVNGKHELIPHNGTVVIEDFVDIGANVCIDRAKFGSTLVAAGTKMDNLVQIAHNVKIGKCCLIAAQVGIAGSSIIGDGAVFGGQAGIADNINVGTKAMIGAKTGVLSDIKPSQKVFGTPAKNFRDFVRDWKTLENISKTKKKIDDLLKRIERLEAAENNKK